MAKISIITSLYKSEKYLKKYFRALNKFDANADFEYEIILISNDCSKKEESIISQNLKKNIKFHKVSRESLYKTWNRGIELAEGDFITFWNVDDIRFPEAINPIFTNKNFDIFYFPFRYKRYINLFGLNFLVKNKIVHPSEYNKGKFLKEMHCGPFFVVKKSTFEKIGLFDSEFKISGDFEWCAKAAFNNLKFKKIDKIAGIFTNNGKTLSGSKNDLQKIENEIIYDRYR
jgi:GT2 family glycosyltransferase